MICECADTGCKHCGGTCGEDASVVLYRIDMQDETGTHFCDMCANDALESGLYTDEHDDTSWELQDYGD